MDVFTYRKNGGSLDLIEIKDCFHPVERQYGRGEIITICSSENDEIGIIKNGIAYVSTSNSDDQRRIIDYCRRGDYFGGHFLTDMENKLYYVTAKTECRVVFISYKRLINCCENCCTEHVELINRLFSRSIRKANVHIDVLCQRTLRGKLEAYFKFLQSEYGKSFTLPMPLSDLADYLAVDRSAMMREIKKMNEEGIIKSERRKVTILMQNS